MKEHDWIKEEVDYGPLGVEDEFRCKNCGAFMMSFFNSFFKFLPKYRIPGTQVPLPEDCDKSRRIVQKYWEKEGKKKVLYKKKK